MGLVSCFPSVPHPTELVSLDYAQIPPRVILPELSAAGPQLAVPMAAPNSLAQVVVLAFRIDWASGLLMDGDSRVAGQARGRPRRLLIAKWQQHKQHGGHRQREERKSLTYWQHARA